LKNSELETALRQLSEQRRVAAQLRRDYVTIMRSRFHAVRMLWFSLRKALGFSSSRDRYAAWSDDFSVGFSATAESTKSGSRGLTEERLLAGWRARMQVKPLSLDPIVSVVIPVYNKVDVTMHCLQSIADTWFETLEVQIIVVDDGSSDRTRDIMGNIPGLEYVRNERNLGFIGACNRGAELARGKYVCFLNNDTEVRDGWLDYLVSTAEGDSTVGVVGAKLIYPDGTLQEAGSILWRDASGWNYGRGENPKDSRFNYTRDVDYCSGAALLVRRDIFTEFGGFSADFAPMYYEDADLCMAVRAKGYRVVYQPRAEVVHLEGATSGTDLSAGSKKYQAINKPKFQQKWASALEAHFENSPLRVPQAARRLRTGKTILIIDSYVPMYDKDAGSARLIQVIRMLRDARYHVIFLPDNYAALQPYTSEIQAMGVEVLHHIDKGRPMQKALDEVLPLLDYAWICRPKLFAKYAKSIRRNSATIVLYDTIDLHFVRERREAELQGRTGDSWKAIEREELQAAREADATIVVTESERDILRSRGVDRVFVVPTLHDPEVEVPRKFSESADLLFIGGYNHTPNVDAAKWLCKEIMPAIWARNPSVRVYLLGSNPPEEVRALADDRVSVPGYISDVSEYFMKSRVFVAPLRFGAGIKGKVGQALSFKLPIVLTDVAAEGFGFENGRDCLVANDAPTFAEATLRLLVDEQLWTKLSEESARVLKPFSTASIKPRIVGMLAELSRVKTSVPA
jgi:GT2 family glycosyltransferase